MRIKQSYLYLRYKPIIMKFLTTATLCLGVLLFSCQTNKPNAEEKRVTAQNEAKEDKGIIDEKIVDFLVIAADARAMDTEEGKQGTAKGTTAEIRDYGKLMQEDQPMLLAKIKELAQSHDVTLLQTLSAKRQNALEDLKSETGKKFDKLFIKMMRIDHERDVKEFEKASKFSDPEISQFAAKYLPMIQSHLDKVKALKK